MDIIALLCVVVFLLILLSVRRKCYYCGNKSLLTGKAFDRVMCKKCADKGGRS